MGADLALAIVEMPDVGTLDQKEWYLLLTAYIHAQEPKFLELILDDNLGWSADDDYDDVYGPFLNAVSEVILNDYRDTGFYYINERWCLITGGMTWGDDPTDSWKSVNLLNALVYYDKI